MGFELANIGGRSALVDGDHYGSMEVPANPPAGIGAAHGKFLADGDVITTTIDGIGTLVNRCVRVSDHTSPGDTIDRAS